jgi:diguanylate cyclase (GGDEF)-like protein/PAS domain S-box-containing protein
MEDILFKKLIGASPIGFSYNQMVYDLTGNPIDYILLEINEALCEFTGLNQSVVGKRRSEIVKETPESRAFWLQRYGRVALTGVSETVEHFTEGFQRFVRVFIYSPKKDFFAMLLTDITKERKDLDEKMAMLNVLGEFVYEVDENFILSNVYTRDEHLLILPRLQIIGNPMNKLVPPSHYSIFLDAMKKAKKYGIMQSITYKAPFEKEIIWHKAEVYYVDINGTKKYIARFSNVTEQLNALEALKESEKKYRLLTENSSDVIWVYNVSKMKFTYCSPSSLELRGYTAEESLNLTLEESVTPESFEIINNTLRENLPLFIADPTNNKSITRELTTPHKDGHLVWVEISTKFSFNDNHEIEVIGASRNIDNRKKSDLYIKFFSTHDQLTGLYDRRYFQEQKQLIEKSPELLPLAIALADIDGLKLTNDVFGHQSGDDLLVSFADSMRKVARPSDILFRTGGDEFLMLMPKTTEIQAKEIVATIKQNLSKIKMSTLTLSASFGVVVMHSIDENFTQLLQQADDLMYHQKIIESSDFKVRVIRSVTSRLHKKNYFEQIHSENVVNNCRKIGEALNLTKEEMSDLNTAAFLHDIGKISFSKELLSKKGPLTIAESNTMTRHPEIGYQILRSVDAFSNIATVVLAHHERMDGKGYPKGLKGREIPLLSRIIAVANIYDALTTSGRAFKPYSPSEVVSIMKKEAGTRLDRNIVKVFLQQVLGYKWSRNKRLPLDNN